MADTLRHRGPDGSGAHVEGGVGIGMRRLAIIDVPGGDQPIANEDGGVHVVQNGEIYNYRALCDELIGLGHRFLTGSDTEVIVHAYEQWGGEGFAAHLRGMFAIAILDARRRALWLARDRLGIKPLYYALGPRGFCFASEVKALIASGMIAPAFEAARVCDYLTYGSAAVDASLVQGVSQLLPGTTLQLDVDSLRCRTHRYWSLELSPTREEIDDEDAIDALDAKLRESVQHHLMADVPVGALLSGGVDSSTVVAYAAEQHPGLRTFSIGFDDPQHNELPHARRLARHFSLSHHEHVLAPRAAQVVEQLLDHLDEPFADASAIPMWYVAQLAARDVKVVLSGDGGDELFAGYDRYWRAHRQQALDRVPRVLRTLGANLAQRAPAWLPGRNAMQLAALNRWERYANEMSHFPRWLQSGLVRPELWPPAEQHPIARNVSLLRSYQSGDLLEDCLRFDTTHYLPLDILTKVDRMTMAHSLEARPALLDHELVELAASLPMRLKCRGREQKWLLRRVAERKLPAATLDRPKSGFSVPLRAWFAGPLREMFQDLVLVEGRVLELLRPEPIGQLFRENGSGQRDHGLKLWSLLVLELWLRRLAKSEGPRQRGVLAVR